MSLLNFASQAVPALLGGSGGSTKVSSSNSQSFSGSLDPVFNISLGGGIRSNPTSSQNAVSPSSAIVSPDPETENLLSGLFAQPSYKVYDSEGAAFAPTSFEAGGINPMMLLMIGAGAFLLLKGG